METIRIFQLKHLEETAACLPEGAALYLVYDRNAGYAADKLNSILPVRSSKPITATEAAKTMDTVLEICSWLLEEGAGRDAVLLALGGGITTDIAGFAASIFKRGIRYVNIPTTLLSQVDAGIGGKTGVNFGQYKNMLGAIVQPLCTCIWPGFLETLPEKEFRSGAAELLKTFLLRNEGGEYEIAVSRLSKGLPLGELPGKAAEIKARIVEEDPYEHGVRTILNLGHTFAHALEHEAAVRGDGLSHGEAVAIGIILAATLGDRMGVSREPLEERLKADFRAAGLPVECPYPPESLAPAMAKDKKAAGEKVRFVLLEGIGKPVIREMAVSEAIDILKGGSI